VQVAHVTVADVAEEVRIVEQLENERRIGVCQWRSRSRGVSVTMQRQCWWIPARGASAAAPRHTELDRPGAQAVEGLSVI